MNQAALEELLNELRSTQDLPVASTSSHPPPSDPAPPPVPTQAQLDSLLSSLTANSTPYRPPSAPPATEERDLSLLSFPEAMPYLQDLAGSSSFLDALGELKAEQMDTEISMKDERNRLEADGKRAGLSPHAREQKLNEWDKQALSKWKKLQNAQRSRLQQLGVPTFAPTLDPIMLKRQERVMAVLVGFLDD
ncbi:hypothetical protein MNV49_007500 [Pseudohyphozyma bogoriensis]|nr:hypothetical protein MNV49_007500 [Pseudohyphozyma bogoriensis]